MGKNSLIEMCKNGAYINASTNKNDINYIADCADFEWERVLRLLVLAISEPLFLKEHLMTETKVVKDELVRYLDDYNLILNLELDKEHSGVDRTLAASIKSLNNIELADVENFYKKTHFAKNMRFIIAGDLQSKMEKIKQILEEMNLPKSDNERFERFKSPLHKKEHPIVLEYESIDKFYFSFDTLHKETLSLIERISLLISLKLLTGTYGVDRLTSRINSQARNQGLNYGISSSFNNEPYASMLYVYGEMEKENAGALFDLIGSEIRKILSGGLNSSDIEEIKQKLLGNHYCRELTTQNLMRHYSGYFTKDELIDYDAWIDLLPSINKKQVIETFKQMFAEKHWYLSLLGSETSVYKDILHQKMASIF